MFIQNKEIPGESLTTIMDDSLSIWLWVAILEFFFIVLLIWKLFKNKSNLKELDPLEQKLMEVKETTINMNELMESINGAKDLYKELSRKCHPDRFINSDKQILAQEIFQEISKNKRDHKILTQLKERAMSDLKINFK